MIKVSILQYPLCNPLYHYIDFQLPINYKAALLPAQGNLPIKGVHRDDLYLLNSIGFCSDPIEDFLPNAFAIHSVTFILK